jgi:predicted nucleic acid-binding Zn ribbon protein
MAHTEDEFEGDEADLDEREDPDESDTDADDEAETLPCPFCGKPVYEGADVCPHCRNFVSFGEASGRKPRWVIAAALALLVFIVLVVVRYA